MQYAYDNSVQINQLFILYFLTNNMDYKSMRNCTYYITNKHLQETRTNQKKKNKAKIKVKVV